MCFGGVIQQKVTHTVLVADGREMIFGDLESYMLAVGVSERAAFSVRSIKCRLT